MDITALRRTNLRTAINAVLASKGFKSDVAFCEHYDLNPSHISQLLNGHGSFGERAARNLERKVGWEEGLLDRDQAKAESSAHFKKLDIEAFKKQYNIPDSEDAVLFSNVIEKPLVIRKRWVPVKAYSKMGMDGFFTDMGYDGNGGDGYVPTHSAGEKAYGIKGTGDSMYPAIRNGWYVVCDPDAELTPTEFVQVCLKDGRCTIKEFIGINNNVLNLLAVNGGDRLTFDMDEVESITAITDIVPPSQHKQEHPDAN
ncbi:S24 family peptidase [Acinetobacter sp. NyZ410]|uniref:S24 family peptidase n=1 Tax=Acinetobacter sp. NyZ410 TaxID=2929509 RepID=UPI001FB92C76|nr:S24 family peptidase [Acinetobacter sp. NyZ410]UOH20441.1 S24 family peptidase [Acinetobacter sp. NyZ410]